MEDKLKKAIVLYVGQLREAEANAKDNRVKTTGTEEEFWWKAQAQIYGIERRSLLRLIAKAGYDPDDYGGEGEEL